MKLRCKIVKLGFRQYYAYVYRDDWILLDFYFSKRDAINAIKDYKDRLNCCSKENKKIYEIEFEV